MHTKESMVVIDIQQNMLSTYFWLRTGGAMKFLIVSLRKSTMVCTPNTRLLTGSSVNYNKAKNQSTEITDSIYCQKHGLDNLWIESGMNEEGTDL